MTQKFARACATSLAAVILAAAAACSSASGTATAGSTSMPHVTGIEETNLVVSDFPAIDSAGLYIAVSQGLFKKEGLNVTVIPDFKSSQDTVNQIQSGKAQISSGDYVTYMGDIMAGTDPLEIVGEGSVLQPNVLALMTGPGNKVTSISQLRGTAVPISGAHDIGSLLIDAVLKQNGVPGSSVHYVPGVPLPAVPAMVAQGKFTAGPVPEPFVAQGQQQFGDGILADLDQGAVESFPIVGYAATPAWAAAHPNTLKAFTAALNAGQAIADTQRSAVEKAVEGAPLKVPAAAADVMNLPSFPVGIDPVRLQRVVTEMIEFNFFSGPALAKAKSFNVRSILYKDNLANGNGIDVLTSS